MCDLKLIAQRLRGDQADFDIVSPTGEVIVKKDQRITARHVREIDKAKMTELAIPPEHVVSFLAGRPLGEDVIDAGTGELIAQANEVVTADLIQKFMKAGIAEIRTLYTNELDRGSYISDTLRIDSTRDAMEAQIEIYRMMRPGEPPTKEAAQTSFRACFSVSTATIFRQSGA